MKSIHRTVRFSYINRYSLETRPARLATESDVMLSVNGNFWLDFHCSPVALDALAAGFLFNEGFVETAEEISDIRVCEKDDNIDVWLNHPIDPPVFWSRGSGCNNSIQPGQHTTLVKLPRGLKFTLPELYEQMENFHAALAKQSRDRHGIHTSMLLDGTTAIQVIADIGRHNTLDKLAGICLLRALTLARPALITTGRISADMVRKAARMKTPLVISLHSTSDRAVRTARELGITLIGQARLGRMDVYTHAERILLKRDTLNR
ncbi:MAG: formate dehydrogenase accessory sulfurtransferase FdhD [Anaerolineaceae bacterium]